MRRIELAGPRVFTVADVLDAAECTAWIEHAERRGFGAPVVDLAGGPRLVPDLRNNARLVHDDPTLAAELWGRVSSVIPAGDDWMAVALSARFKFYRYHPGEYFGPHSDGRVAGPPGDVSRLTMVVYLNDDYIGGETCFQRQITVRPKTGTALFFRHEIVHEGVEVRRGVKYVLRTDVMARYAG